MVTKANKTVKGIMDDYMILEAAYLAGFEPSSDDIPAHKEVQEAIEFLTIKHI